MSTFLDRVGHGLIESVYGILLFPPNFREWVKILLITVFSHVNPYQRGTSFQGAALVGDVGIQAIEELLVCFVLPWNVCRECYPFLAVAVRMVLPFIHEYFAGELLSFARTSVPFERRRNHEEATITLCLDYE